MTTKPKRRERADRSDALSERERRFVEHYLATGNASESYRAAAFRCSLATSWVEGPRLLARPRVAKAVREAADATSAELATTRATRTRWLLGIRDGTILVEHTMATGKGIETALAPAPARERLKAAELLARMNGDLLERVEVAHTLADLVDRVGAESIDDEPGAERHEASS